MDENKKTGLMALLNSRRGQYIISQALFIAIKELEKVEEPLRENSNINDMKLLMDNIFSIYKILSEKPKDDTDES